MLLPTLVAFGVLLHVLFWGAGLAALLMPRPWRAFWPVLAAPAGLALQSLAVWLGAHTHLAGTDAYAWPAEVVPLGLLVLGLRRRRAYGLRDIGRFSGIALGMAVLLAVLVWPLSRAASGLTTASLGNCDAADYAAGARVLQQFASTDRTGFLGLTEVVRVMSVDNFFDFWLKLNHFTPSALIAFNGTILHCVPRELTSLATMAFFVSLLPLAFWMSRALFRYRGAAAWGLTMVFGLSPILWYAVYQVAIGQLLAAAAVALLTWAGVELWRGGPSARRGARLAGVLAVGYVLILGSYNFFVVLCLVPAGAWVLFESVRRQDGRRFGVWLLGMLLPLAGISLIFWQRVSGLAERFFLFRNYDFGWRIPLLGPEGWLGLVGGENLQPLAGAWRLALMVVFGLAWAAALRRGFARGDRRPAMILCFVAPIVLGYAYLEWRGVHFHTNASYDAYKMLAVFYPVLLPALCFWAAPPGKSPSAAWVAAGLGVVLLAGNAGAARDFLRAASHPPLIVDRDLAEVRRVETMLGVPSLNLRLPDMWSRLWANAFLLRKPQYFPTHTYEGRRNTPLRGSWDLTDNLIDIVLPNGASQRLNAQYSLVDVTSPYAVRADFGEGWYETERLPRSSERWRWSRLPAVLRLDNLHGRTLRAILRFDARSLVERDVEVWRDGRQIASGRVGTTRATTVLGPIAIPPGPAPLELRSDRPPSLAPGDDRPLGICLYGLTVEVQRQGAGK